MALPPTSSKLSSDANEVTTFKFDFPNFTGTHTGILVSLAVNSVAGGGTGLSTLTANNVILGNGTSSPTFVAPGTSGNVLTSDGTTWTSQSSTAATVVAKFGVDPTTSGTLSTTASGAVVFPFVYYDTNSAYNNSTGIFTAPVTGYYDIFPCSFFTAVTSTNLYVFVNGSVVAGRVVHGSNTPYVSPTQIHMVANDALTFVTDTNQGYTYTALSGASGFIPTITVSLRN